MDTQETILTLEKEALDQWSNGNPGGCSIHYANDAVYVDDIGAQNPIEGKEKIKAYMDSLKEAIPAHKYEIVHPKIQVYGDTSILSYFYHPFTLEGEPGTKWRTSCVYVRLGNEWKLAHAHWTMLKEEDPNNQA
jgi:ketosteroid isomerase-like protein